LCDRIGGIPAAAFVLLGFAVALATAALGEDDCRCGTPDAEQIAVAEAKIGRRPLPLGERYCASTVDRGRRFIGQAGSGRRQQSNGRFTEKGASPIQNLEADHEVTGAVDVC
jgi:hypothetical protein